MGQPKPVLALNCGSSSLKFGLFLFENARPTLLCEGEAEEIGKENSGFWFQTPGKSTKSNERIALHDHSAALTRALRALKEFGAPAPAVIGHRLVHGGPRVRTHQRMTPDVRQDLQSAVEYAPLHVPAALAVLDAVQHAIPEAAEIVCLDTAFHRTIPDVARTFPLPGRVRSMGLERYGFHGLSLESVVAQLEPLPERLVIAHLGNGASITAIRNGGSIDTSMGLTPTGGVMMGTRCGDLDPGLIVFLIRHGYRDPEALEKLFDNSSGLLGVSGKSSDVRELLNARSQSRDVDLALRMFCYQARKCIAEMAAALGGVDAVVFTGGIGEHAAELRDEICSGLKFLGRFEVLVRPSQEDLQIATVAARLV